MHSIRYVERDALGGSVDPEFRVEATVVTNANGEFAATVDARVLEETYVLLVARSAECIGLLSWTEATSDDAEPTATRLEIPLDRRTESIEGLVRNDASGTFAGVDVVVLPDWGDWARLDYPVHPDTASGRAFLRDLGLVAQTDSGGRFRLDGLPADADPDILDSSYWVVARDARLVGVPASWGPCELDACTDLEAEVPLKDGIPVFRAESVADLTLSGRVTDLEGTAIGPGSVFVDECHAAEIAADGCWSIHGFPAGSSWRLRVHVPGFVDLAWVSRSIEVLKHADKDVRIELHPLE